MRNKIICLGVIVISAVISAGSMYIARSYYINWKIALAQPLYLDKFSSVTNQGEESNGHLVVLFGDSRVANWTPIPNLPGYKVVNHGIGGETTEQMKYRFEKDVIRLKPDMVVIQAGINDLVAASLSSKTEEQIVDNLKNNYQYFMDRCKENGVSVVFTTIVRPAQPPFQRRIVWSDRVFKLVESINKYIRDLTLKGESQLIDIDSILSSGEDGSEPLSVEYAVDTLHFKSVVYEQLNNNLLRKLK